MTTESTSESSDSPAEDASKQQPGSPASRPSARRPLVVAVSALVLAAVIAVALVVTRWGSSPPSPPVDAVHARISHPAVAMAFVTGAITAVTAVSTYDYRSLDDALNNGLPGTTGAYRMDFRAALTGGLAAEAKRTHRAQQFSVEKAGIGTINGDGSTAKVLMFGTQRVTDDSTGDRGRVDVVTLTATMVRRGKTFLISALDADANAGLPPGTAALSDAAEAARSEVVNLLSFRRAHFAADLQRALDGAVEPLRADIGAAAARTRANLTKGGYDLRGSVTALAVERASDDTAVLLVAASGLRVDGSGQNRLVADTHYEIAVVRTADGWKASEAAPVVAG